MDIPHLFIHSSFNGHWSWFHLLAIMTNTAVNIGIHKSVSVFAFNSFGYVDKSRIVGLNVSRLCQASRRGQNHPRLRTTYLKEQTSLNNNISTKLNHGLWGLKGTFVATLLSESPLPHSWDLCLATSCAWKLSHLEGHLILASSYPLYLLVHWLLSIILQTCPCHCILYLSLSSWSPANILIKLSIIVGFPFIL